MKFGVLGFSYAGFEHFASSIEKAGYYSANLGDSAQTIASRHVYSELGVGSDEMILIDRDALRDYDGPPAFLIMNGVFTANSLPTPPQITPVFVGFNAPETVIRSHRDWLKAYEPIGCRDVHTANLLVGMDVDAFTCGCVTMTLPPRSQLPERGRLLIVSGSMAGAMPMSVLSHVPLDLLEGADFIHHRLPTRDLPLSADACAWHERVELDILRRYRDEASVVLTPLLHVASPCLAMQVPVIVSRVDQDPRFSLLREFMPIYTPDRFAEIDWRPGVVNVSAYAESIVKHVGACLDTARSSASI